MWCSGVILVVVLALRRVALEFADRRLFDLLQRRGPQRAAHVDAAFRKLAPQRRRREEHELGRERQEEGDEPRAGAGAVDAFHARYKVCRGGDDASGSNVGRTTPAEDGEGEAAAERVADDVDGRVWLCDLQVFEHSFDVRPALRRVQRSQQP
eukprot:CAMPEP_0206809478 /NCGR_PEP_ID=MMETSP0975-20121206/6265_1 /ASSEMBLY_ACC=CAM_ASM_000399 /TAXON_ID=483370 /ORGANISM="non described non described, Strain CCMP2097" /LENGTH=152 /DNA_ID=CAMNT_0054351575 /DNA_START=300 /DNA_END=757 /DNA_ORIENTATION=+